VVCLVIALGLIPEAAAAEPSWVEVLDLRAGSVLSPGSLAQAHSMLEGASRCGDCHASLGATPDARCLDCHEEIGERMQAQVGWHGRVQGRCAACHAEHRGTQADLLGLDPDAFNHDQARFALSGAHTAVPCEDCHRRAGEGGRLGFHPLGIAHQRCGDCHEDVHGAGFLRERDCEVCHSDASFRAAGPEAGFDHARDTRFALRGAHARVACAECHTVERRAAERWAARAPGSTAPQRCAGCHADPHERALGDRCIACHDERAWKGAGLPFDHERDTRFRLDVLHARLACEECHTGASFSAPGLECVECHPDADQLLHGRGVTFAAASADPHAGTTGCRDCHAASVAKPSLLDYERACLTCHPPEYGSLLVSRKRIVDGLLVQVEAARRSRELAARRGERIGPETPALGEAIELLARTGLHHPVLAERALEKALEELAREPVAP
jgi:hypothetical protein